MILNRDFHIGRIESVSQKISDQIKPGSHELDVRIKVGCIFPMVIWSEIRMGQYRVDDHP